MAPASVSAWVTSLCMLLTCCRASYLFMLLVPTRSTIVVPSRSSLLSSTHFLASCRVGAHALLTSRLIHLIKCAWISLVLESPTMMVGVMGGGCSWLLSSWSSRARIFSSSSAMRFSFSLATCSISLFSSAFFFRVWSVFLLSCWLLLLLPAGSYCLVLAGGWFAGVLLLLF